MRSNLHKITEALLKEKDESAIKVLEDAGVELRNPDGSFRTVCEILKELSERWDPDKSTTA